MLSCDDDDGGGHEEELANSRSSLGLLRPLLLVEHVPPEGEESTVILT